MYPGTTQVSRRTRGRPGRPDHERAHSAANHEPARRGGYPPSWPRFRLTGAVAFDVSSTVMRLATTLPAARDLMVLTNGPDTFAPARTGRA